MKRLSTLVVVVGAVTMLSPGAAATAQEPPIPNIEGVWEVRALIKATNWDATWDHEVLNDSADLCHCGGIYFDDVPNFILVPLSDPDDFFFGFVRDKAFAFYKDDSEPGNVGLEMVTGTVKENRSRMQGELIGFDSKYEWGATWSASFVAKRSTAATTQCWRCP